MPVPTSDKLDPISPAIVAKPVEHTRQKLLMEGDGADLFEAVVPIQVHEASQAFDQAKKTKVICLWKTATPSERPQTWFQLNTNEVT